MVAYAPIVLFHGTTAEVSKSIVRRGLVEPWPGRGVAVTSWRWYARWAAQTACLVARRERGSDEREAVGLIVHLGPGGLEMHSSGALDFAPSWSVEHVPRRNIVSLERVSVRLPEPGSDDERGMLRAGFASRQPGRYAEQTREIVTGRRDSSGGRIRAT